MFFNFKFGFFALAAIILVLAASNFESVTDGSRRFLSEASGLFKETFFPQDNFTEVAVIPLNSGTGTAEQTASVSKNFSAAAPAKVCGFDSAPTRVAEKIIFNEIAWMGNLAGFDREWIELKNISDSPADISGFQILDKDEQIKIVFPKQTLIPSGRFYLLERGGEAVPNLKADLIYSGNLRNSDEELKFFDGDCNLIDEVAANPNWPAGDNKNKSTMERNSDGIGWHTSRVVEGTPGKENSSAPISPTGQVGPIGTIGLTEQTTNQTTTSETFVSPEPVIARKININTAGYEELQKITGVGPVIAQRIVDYRNVNGPFLRIEDVGNVKGIGDVTFKKMQDEITI